MGQFEAFVVFAEMRTGSNFLEANLNAFDGVSCCGEAFNPHFIGYPNADEVLGFSQSQRDANPLALLDAFRHADGMAGFRFFHDHDPRIFDAILEDSRVAKIILTRNPVESYVSWKIAQSTGQWKLTDVKRRKTAKAVFDADEFEAHLDALQDFQVKLMNRLQVLGQTAFYVDYEDLRSLDVMNGLAKYLGVKAELKNLDKKLKVQNPSPVREKVSNVAAMEDALSRLDRFNLSRTPNFEQRRPAGIPNYVAAAQAPLLYMPMKCGPETQIRQWLADLDSVKDDALRFRMTQKELRQWKRRNPGHRSFTVLRHPLARVHHAFCKHILNTGAESYAQIRASLISRFGIPVPESLDKDAYNIAAHKTAFLAFLDFLAANLSGQTAIRVDGAWCTQAQALQGFGQFSLPDRVIREADLDVELTDLARAIGYETPPALPSAEADSPFTLAEVYDDEIEDRVSKVYQRDYMMFGFDRWDR